MQLMNFDMNSGLSSMIQGLIWTCPWRRRWLKAPVICRNTSHQRSSNEALGLHSLWLWIIAHFVVLSLDDLNLTVSAFLFCRRHTVKIHTLQENSSRDMFMVFKAITHATYVLTPVANTLMFTVDQRTFLFQERASMPRFGNGIKMFPFLVSVI